MGTPALVCCPPALGVHAVVVVVSGRDSSRPCCSSRPPITRSHWHPPSHRFHRLQLRRAPVSACPSSSSSSSPAEDSRPAHVPSGPSASQPPLRAAGSPPPSSDPPLPSPKQDNVDVEAQPQQQITAAQSAFEKAMAYKKMKSNPNRVVSSSAAAASQPQTLTLPSTPVPPEVEIPADTCSSQLRTSSPPNVDDDDASANPDLNVSPSSEENVVEIEIHTRDGIVRRKVLNPETAFANVKDLKRKGVSSLDFVGLGFADKKLSTSGRPAGLREAFEAPSGPLPEVDVLTRDAGVADPEAMVEGSEVYKPRVTTWGMFPRPADISKAYGGGRTIKPGQKLETEEEKVARETKTKKLLSEYKKKFGLDMAPKDRVRCERNMKNGQELMDRGQLREAQAAFITVKDEMPFPSELHGMAALQEAVCLESLNRSDEAKIQYEKLLSHPNGAVRKKARQLLFGFQAAERLKVRAGYNWDSSSYRKYFDAFADGYNTMYTKSEEEKKKEKEEEEALMQNLRFALLLLVPVILVVTLVATKS